MFLNKRLRVQIGYKVERLEVFCITCTKSERSLKSRGKGFKEKCGDDNGKLVACLEVRGNKLVQAKLILWCIKTNKLQKNFTKLISLII